MKKVLNINTKLILLILCMTIIFSSCSPFLISTQNKYYDNNLIINFIDVGQGDCTLIQVNNKNILIDAGPFKSKDKVITFLKSKGIKKFDYVIATHPHEDHIGGMSEIINNFQIENFYAPKVSSNSYSFKNMITSLKKKNMKINIAKAGIPLDLGKDTVCEIIAPNRIYYEKTNDYSAVIKIVYKNNSFLFCGDAENVSEREILNANYDISANLLKCGHHGSNTSTCNEFLEKVNPNICVILCGKNNKYGHPHKNVLEKLNNHNCKIYRSDLNGNITVISDGNSLKIQTDK